MSARDGLSEDDAFWADQRARAVAERGKQADPSACGTCRDLVAAGRQVEHDECARRATLLEAPDAPGYELITGLSEAELRALPPRFHIPVFMDTATPQAWACAVCWGDGWATQWPCKTAVEHGARVFTQEHYVKAAPSEAERTMLAFALDLAGEEVASRGDDFTDVEKDALKSLRRLVPKEASS